MTQPKQPVFTVRWFVVTLFDEVEVVVEFLNTVDIGAGSDDLGDDDVWQAWCADRALRAPGPVAVARRVRDALRQALADASSAPRLAVPATLEIIDGHPQVSTADAPAHLLLVATRLVDVGDWHRLKLCTDDTCRWAFFDQSRNRSRAWCSMEVCGNRAKARSFRARARSHSD